MTRIMQHTVLGMIGMALVMAVPLLQGHLDQQRAATPKLQGFLYVPQGEYLRIAVLGYDQVVADFLWIQAIQAMGGRKVSPEVGPWLVQVLDVITTLDPQYTEVYEGGGIALVTLFPLYKESNQLLEKGMVHIPLAWKLPFYAGFTSYFNLIDDLKAAEYFARASRLPGAPAWLPGLAARFFVSARSPQSAINFLMDVYSKTTDLTIKRALEDRVKGVIVERDLLLLEEAIRLYRESNGRAPRQLEDLVRAQVLREIPREPFGGRYVYDPETTSVRSSELKERMKVHGKRMPL
jgi:hypothetical protein